MLRQKHKREKSHKEPQRMGRWATMTIQFAQTRYSKSGKVHIISVYRTTTTNSGDNSSMMQQRRELMRQGRQISPLAAFAKDIEEHLNSLHKRGDCFLIAGDFNCSLMNPVLTSITEKFSLTDIMSSTHTETPPTREHGSQTIDHMLISTSMLETIRRAEYLPFKYGVNSDHRALALDLDLERLKGDPEIKNERPQRVLDSRNCTTARKYKDTLTEFLKRIGKAQPLINISAPRTSRERRKAIRNLEMYDRKQTQMMLKTERSLPKKREWQWSPQLHEAVKIHQYWSIRQNAASGGRELHPDAKERIEESVKTLDKYQGHPEWTIWKQRRKSLQRLREANKQDGLNRQKFLDELIEQRSDAEATSVRAIKHNEYIIRLHRGFNLIIKPRRAQINKLQKKSRMEPRFTTRNRKSSEPYIFTMRFISANRNEGNPLLHRIHCTNTLDTAPPREKQRTS